MENFNKLPLKLRQLLFLDTLNPPKFIKISFFLFHILTLFLFALLCFATIFQTPFNIETFMSGLMLSTVTVLNIIKFIFIGGNFEKLRTITRSSKKTFEDFKRRNFKIFFNFFCGFACMQFFAVTMECLKKVFEGNFEFPLHLKFPFDTSKPGAYTLAMLWYLYAHLLLVLLHNVCDIFVYEIIFSISMEFKVLRRKFEALKVPTLENLKHPKVIVARRGSKVITKQLKPFVDEIRAEKFLKLIESHKNLLRKLKELKKILEIPFAFTFIVSSSIICSILFRMTIVGYSLTILTFGLIINFNKIFLQCFFGQLLMDSCEEVAEGIFGCSWEEFEDEGMRKMIVVMIKRAKKGDGFKIMRFIKVDLEQFVMVIQASYSYYMLLRTLYFGE